MGTISNICVFNHLRISIKITVKPILKTDIMKSTIKLFFITIILLFFNKILNAQASEYFHSFSTQINIPIIVDYKKVFQNKENVTEKHIPDKQISIVFYIKVEDMRFDGNEFFSGMSMVRYSDNDDLKTFYGEVSEDKKTIKYIELSRCFTEFSSVKRESAYPVKTINISIRIENIPFWIGKYKFKHGESKITKVEYKSRYFKKSVYDRSETRTENFVKVNYEKITAYSTPIYVSFKQGKLKTEQVTHVKIEGPDTVCRPQISKYYDEDKCAHIFVAKSDIKAGNFKWETESENIHLFPDKESSARLKIYVDFDPYGADSAVIKVTQKIGTVEYSATHVLHIQGGYYYFWPNCDKLLELGIITKAEWDECDEDYPDVTTSISV